MRPIKLTMTAFGPYSGSEVVDFNSLEEKNLFLITGPTGAGKTTVFDAISYALYGESSGMDRPVKSLRCDSAPLELLTEVELIFELKGKVYQVHREPSQMKKRVRGEGLTEHKPQATLYLDGKERPITGKDNVTRAIKDLIGLEVEQFRQIMMIPQGEFRKLLMAKSDERTSILKSIFQTTLYSTLQKKFSEEKREIEDEIKGFLTKRIEAIEKINVDEETPEGQGLSALISAEDKHVDLILSTTEASIVTDEKKSEVLDKSLQKIKSESQKLVEKKTAAGFNNQKIATFKKNKEALEKLELKKAEVDEKKKTLVLLEKALSVSSVEANFLKLKKEYIETRDELRALKVELTAIEKEVKGSEIKLKEADSEENNHVIETYQKEEIRLNGFVERLLAAEDDRVAINELQEKKNQLHQSKEKLQALVEANKNSLEATTKEIDDIANLKEELVELARKKESIHPQLQLLKRYLDLQAQYNQQKSLVDENTQKLSAEKETVNVQEEKYKEAKRIWHLNQAALLAQDLKSGEACPVCGSREHLELAKFTENHVSEETLHSLEAALTKALNNKNNMQSAYDGSVTLLGRIEEELMILVTQFVRDKILDAQKPSKEEVAQAVRTKEETLTIEIEALTNKYEGLNKKVKGRDAIVKRKETLEAQVTKAGSELEETKDLYNQCLISLKEKEARKAALISEIPEGLQAVDKLNAYLLEIKGKRHALIEEKEALLKEYNHLKEKSIQIASRYEMLEKRLGNLETKCIQEKQELMAYLEEQGFESLEQYRPYRDKLGEIEPLGQVIKTYEQSYHLTQKTCDQQWEEVKDLEYVVITSFDEQLDKVRVKEDLLINKMNAIGQRIGHNRVLVDEINEIIKRMADKEEKYKVMGHLSDVINGNNSKKLTFERYILATYLQDILVVANHRLSRMTNNRYALKISTNVFDKRSSSGLDLEVFDSYTGVERSVKTLSGGESFKASLAMALALAEVVQAYAGGIQLDTVFIDEGFGTLDQESLDSAINCLVELQDSGRLVGIISHVQELKERIQTQLIVEMDESGSKTQFIVE